MQKVNIIYTRFSLISKKQEWWNILSSKMDFEMYKKLILDESRISDRLDIFLNYQLPLLEKASLDFNIHQYVMTSSYLPEWVIEALKNAENRYSFLKIDFFDEETIPNLKIEFSNYLKKFDDNIIACITRLDDDDLLHCCFFENIQKYMDKHFVGLCISQNTGYAGMYKNKRFEKFSKLRFINSAQGLSYIAEFDKNQFTTPYITPPGSHTTVDKIVPCINDGTINCYIYTFHGNNGYFNTVCDQSESFIEKKFFSSLDDMETVDKYYFGLFSKSNILT